MGITSIHILQEDDDRAARRAEEALLVRRAAEHRNGEHEGYGNKRRDCPLCVQGR